ncbi:cobalamin 5'-phosphate synthase [Croceicoccus estronivorus]|uniref:adenosylcobinamide-GDP ribazoletransferase n=1 Tax=Croceicoccus estronivorus TaxID=1172626 RepID=UPI0008323EDF|nr:adenosylcobinamide-GDP ribazoletransferase [Croceicoccus estronivorus]OCC24185.1 cobalamin 5'-phosphate synthase [Croceicoccus estronivorus]
MKGAIIALQFMTRLPMPRISVSSAEFAASIRWFPIVGVVVGSCVAGAAWAGSRIDPWTGALTALVVWIGVTGALHLDGLGDIADASGAIHKDRAKLLEVLADPHIGTFGTVAIGLQLLAKLLLLQSVIELSGWTALVLTPFAARFGPLVWTVWLPPLHEGLGARFKGAIRPWHLCLWFSGLIACTWEMPAILVTPVLVFLWGRWVMRRIGGISGDSHGAGIEIIETGLLLAWLIWARFA